MAENYMKKVLAILKDIWKYLDRVILGEVPPGASVAEEPMADGVCIGDLPGSVVYYRRNGETWMRIGGNCHVRVKVQKEHVIGDGIAEEFDPKELVRRYKNP